jgi:hypothetical protein
MLITNFYDRIRAQPLGGGSISTDMISVFGLVLYRNSSTHIATNQSELFSALKYEYEFDTMTSFLSGLSRP